MWLKIVVSVLFVLMLLAAFLFEDRQDRELSGEGGPHGEAVPRFRLMSWNIGYGNLEPDTRAHTEDLAAVAQIILTNNPDAVAIQELTGEDQLKLLLAQLKNRYDGFVSKTITADRVVGVLVKRRNPDDFRPRFESIPAGEGFAAAATFRWTKLHPAVVLISAHADAFNAARRRAFLADLVEWAVRGKRRETIFIAGDLNFEVSTQKQVNLFTDNAKHDSESYASLLKHFGDLGQAAGETAVNDRRIDYVFGPPDGSVARAEVLRETAIGRMDHWPLLIEIAFEPCNANC